MKKLWERTFKTTGKWYIRDNSEKVISAIRGGDEQFT